MTLSVKIIDEILTQPLVITRAVAKAKIIAALDILSIRLRRLAC